jgi:predicted ArsR family transcriptional regulator
MSVVAESELARSRDRILELLLKSEEPLSVQTLSRALGISRNAAHQHVMALEREKLIERAMSIRTRGRPSQGYRLSDAGSATFRRQYALLAKELLAELSRHLSGDALRDAMGRIGETLAGRIADGKDVPIADIAETMAGLGYEAKAVDAGDGQQEIEAHNCVFHDLAFADPTICEVDLALLSKLSGKQVDHRRCMARGERSCRFAFVPKTQS